MSWAKDARQQFIAQRLKATGKINRGEICDAFQITPAVASTDLRAFMAAYPDLMRYDSRAKAYVVVPAIPEDQRPVWAKGATQPPEPAAYPDAAEWRRAFGKSHRTTNEWRTAAQTAWRQLELTEKALFIATQALLTREASAPSPRTSMALLAALAGLEDRHAQRMIEDLYTAHMENADAHQGHAGRSLEPSRVARTGGQGD